MHDTTICAQRFDLYIGLLQVLTIVVQIQLRAHEEDLYIGQNVAHILLYPVCTVETAFYDHPLVPQKSVL